MPLASSPVLTAEGVVETAEAQPYPAQQPRPAREQPARRAEWPRLGYRPALDGIRALAVAAVFAYHANVHWARAGFLGVDVFFVLSGFLITSLLLTERRREGRIDLVRFWGRRARRLLPAVVVLLAAVAVAMPVLAADQAYRLRGDLIAALGYVSNWRLVFGHESYFQAAGRPPLLQHLWSLAVEEQFYLLWPPVLVLALRKRPYRSVLKPILIAAAASAALMALLFHPFTDPSRVYYGTDTRAFALLIGAALAAATVRWHLVDRIRPAGRLTFEVAGIAALGGLAWAVSHINEFDPALYRGGFLMVAVLAAGLVAAAARPGPAGPLGRALGCRPMVWVGQRSYAAYLWFWPVLMVTRPHRDVPLGGLPLLALRIALTLLLAAASYRFVERPVRDGSLGRVWSDLRWARATRSTVRRRSAAWGLALSVVLACLGVGVAIGHGTVQGPKVEVASGLNAAAAAKVGAIRPLASGATIPAASAQPATALAGAVPSAAAQPAAPATTDPPAPPVPTVPAALPTITAKVTAVGDSVMLGAKPLLEHQIDGVVVDAIVGRQFNALVTAVKGYRDAGTLGEAVVLHPGNNGAISPGQFDQLMELVKGVTRVVVINDKVDRAWQDNNNDVIDEGVRRWPNAVLIDWHAIASLHPDAFVEDGLHLTSTGIRLLTGAIISAVSAP